LTNLIQYNKTFNALQQQLPCRGFEGDTIVSKLFAIYIVGYNWCYKIVLDRNVQYWINSSFVLNNKPDALIIQIYSVIKLYMFRASSVPIIRSFLLYIRHW